MDRIGEWWRKRYAYRPAKPNATPILIYDTQEHQSVVYIKFDRFESYHLKVMRHSFLRSIKQSCPLYFYMIVLLERTRWIVEILCFETRAR